MRPNVIMFDAGGTLVLQNPVLMGSKLGTEIDPDAAFHAHYLTMAEFSERKDRGEAVTWDWWLEQYFHRLGHGDPATAGAVIDRGYGLWSWAIPGVVEAVERIVAMGIRVSVVSNSDGSVAASLRDAGFDERFEDVVDSQLVGFSKPDPRIFALACQRLDVDPGHAWYVGDSLHHDVGGATAAGLGAAWLVDPLGLYPDHPRRLPSVAHLPERLSGNPG
jgi:HAD superfamily hydrolase (TIGR01509 family)